MKRRAVVAKRTVQKRACKNSTSSSSSSNSNRRSVVWRCDEIIRQRWIGTFRFWENHDKGFKELVKMVSRELFGVQAQELDSGLFSLWNRVGRHGDGNSVVSEEMLRNYLAQDKHLIRIWSQRGTLHLVAFEDWDLIRHCFKDDLLATRTLRMKKLGIGEEFEREYAYVKDKLERDDKVTVVEDVEDDRLRYSIRMSLTLEGLAFRNDLVRGRAEMMKRTDMKPGHVDKDAALLECGKRYFRAYGPATEKDFRHFSGLKAGDSKSVIGTLIGNHVIESIDVVDEGEQNSWYDGKETMYAMVGQTPPVKAEHNTNIVRFLGRFDPLLLAHANKFFLVDESYKPLIWGKAANVYACLMVDYKLCGTWTKRKKANHLEISIAAFPTYKQLIESRSNEIKAEATRLAQFFQLDDVVVDIQ